MSSGTEEKAGLLSRLGLNDNKAGMQNLDREKINQIIYEASKGSKYFENEKKKDKQVDIKIAEQQQKIASFTAKEMNKAEKEADALLKRLEEKRDLSRTIVHIDMDAFFAAVETRDNPSLLDKPMAVGSNYMLSTSNYIARRFGVRAAMPGFIAKKLCPQLVIVPQNFAQYAAVSKEVKDVLVKYDKHFCPISFDEAYLDITEHLNLRKTFPKEKRTVQCRTCDRLDPHYCSCDPNKSDCESTENEDLNFVQDKETPSADQLCFQEQDRSNLLRIEDPTLVKGQDLKMCPLCKREVPNYREEVFGVSAEEAVREIRRKIEQRTQLTASAGIAANTLLAKICSDKNKPNGQFSLPHITHVIKDFITDLPIRKVSGIGKVTEKMLQAIDIVTCSQLYEQRSLLYLLYSETSFKHFMSIALGIGSTRVESDGDRKSLSTEQTFFELSDPAQLYDKCLELSKILASDLQEQNFMGRTVSLKIKTVDFDVKTKSQTLTRHTCDEVQIYNVARNFLQSEIQNSMPKPFRLRLMGVRMSNLISSSQFAKKDSIEYFLKKDSSLSDTNVLTEHEGKYQNEMAPNQCGQAESSSDCLEKGISESPGHYCPICDRKCPKNLRLFNAHIDKCLLQQSRENDRKTKRASPVITNADFEDFLEFSTIKTSRKTRKKTKMTQKNLKTVFEETFVRNGIPTDSCLEKSSECKCENLSETENILKQRKDCKKTGTKENSSEIEPKESNGVILGSCVDSGTLKNHPFSDGVAEVEEESCLHENKSLSPSVSKLSNSEELLVSGCEKPSPKCSTTTADISKVSELNDANTEQMLTRLHRTKEEPSKVDRIDLVKICPEDVTNPHKKQSDCDNKENGTDCSSADIANSTGPKPFDSNIETKLKKIQNNKFSKKTVKNCNLLKYFSKSNVNKREEVKQCLGSSESLKWSESTDRVVVEKTDRSILDETISSEQVDAGGLLNNEDITDQQQTAAKTSLSHSMVCDKLQKQVDSEKDINLVTDKLQQEVDSGQINSLDCDKLQQEVETGQESSLVVEKVQQIVETGQINSLASGKLQKEIGSGQRINLASDKLQKEVDSGQEISLVTEKIQKIKSGQRRSLASDKQETEVQTGQEINQDSNKVETRSDCGQRSSSNVTEQLQKICNSGQLDSVTSGQSHGSANTGQTDCSIFHSHSMKLFPHSTENSIETSESMIKVDTSCNHGDSPNNEIAPSCPPQFQGSTGCVSVDTQFHSPAETTSKLPQDKEFPTERDNGQTTELVHQCPICHKDILIPDMSTFNEHVDLCLNQATIRKILVEQGKELKNSAQLKRPAENPSPDINKRKKSLKHNSTPRIDSYFFSV